MRITRRHFGLAAVSTLIPKVSCAEPLRLKDVFEPPPADMAPNQTQKVPVGLVLTFDASNSVDNAEFQLQAEGTANALESEDVRAAIKKIGAVNICGTQFSTSVKQTLPHALLRTDDDIHAYAQKIRDQKEIDTGYTHISDAVTSSAEFLSQSPYNLTRRVMDISGDGYQQTWSDASVDYLPLGFDDKAMYLKTVHADKIRKATRDAAINFETTVNGLAVCTDISDLDQYFRDLVVTPTEVWSETGVERGRVWAVTHYNHFEPAMRSKLITELAGLDKPHGNPRQVGQIYSFS